MSTADARQHFDDLVTWATGTLQGDEVLLASLRGETSDFVRFNHAAVRQAGSVQQQSLSIDLISGSQPRRGQRDADRQRPTDQARVTSLLAELRAQRAVLPEDPYLLYATDGADSERFGHRRRLPAAADAVDAVAPAQRAATSSASTPPARPTRPSGRRWASATGSRPSTFNLDWSLHLSGDKATKNAYAGTTWESGVFQSKLDWSVRELEALGRRAEDAGRPVATGPTSRRRPWKRSWGCCRGVASALRAHETRQTPLLRMVTDGAIAFAPGVTIREDIAGGVAPDFQVAGIRPPGRGSADHRGPLRHPSRSRPARRRSTASSHQRGRGLGAPTGDRDGSGDSCPPMDLCSTRSAPGCTSAISGTSTSRIGRPAGPPA